MDSQVEIIDQSDVTKGYYASIELLGRVYTLRFKDSGGTVIDPKRDRMLERAESVPRPWFLFGSLTIQGTFIEANGTIRSKPMAGKAIARTKAPYWDPDDFQWVRLK